MLLQTLHLLCPTLPENLIRRKWIRKEHSDLQTLALPHSHTPQLQPPVKPIASETHTQRGSVLSLQCIFVLLHLLSRGLASSHSQCTVVAHVLCLQLPSHPSFFPLPRSPHTFPSPSSLDNHPHQFNEHHFV